MISLDPRRGNNFLDCNALDRTEETEDAAMDKILALHEQPDTFTLLLPYSVKAEIEHPSTPSEKKRKAMGFLYSMAVTLTPPELETHEKLRLLIQGNAKSARHEKDAFHLVESAKYGGRYFITKDRRLLKKAPEIWAALRLRVVTPSEFLSAYRSHSSMPR
jgi:predicted nucleic acid-binding protein